MINFEKLSHEYGTPLFIYNIDELKNRIKYLKSKLGKAQLVFAVKANSYIVKEIIDDVEKFEICSPGEFDICNKLNVPHSKMVISGVNKTNEFIENMVSNYDVGRYTIESIKHYDILSEFAQKYNKKLNVLIRLTSGNQFGVSEEDFKYIIKNNKYLDIKGLEYFSGTQKRSIKKICNEIEYINEFIKSIKEEYNFEFNEVEYGAGLPVSYYESDEFDENELLDQVKELLNTIDNNNILIELGRSICASCGEYLTKVVDIKSNNNGNFVIVDGGINHLVYYGGTLAMKTPYYDIIQKNKGEIINYNVYGSLCTINDVLLKNINVSKLNIDDLFIFKKVGAYSSTEGIALFLSRDLPKIILYKNNKSYLVRNELKTSDINCPSYINEGVK